MCGMTAGPPRPRDPGEDAKISAAVRALLAAHGESVADLAYHTRISAASLYRKLNGEASWKATDVGVVAGHYRLPPGDLFSGLPIAGGDPETGDRRRRRASDPPEQRTVRRRKGGHRQTSAGTASLVA